MLQGSINDCYGNQQRSPDFLDVRKYPRDIGGNHWRRVNSTLGHMSRRHRGMARKGSPGESKTSLSNITSRTRTRFTLESSFQNHSPDAGNSVLTSPSPGDQLPFPSWWPPFHDLRHPGVGIRSMDLHILLFLLSLPPSGLCPSLHFFSLHSLCHFLPQ